MYAGADFIELDVVLTKDKKSIVMHDPYLGEKTNINEFPEFSHLKCTK